jgi:hypothetical protein
MLHTHTHTERERERWPCPGLTSAPPPRRAPHGASPGQAVIGAEEEEEAAAAGPAPAPAPASAGKDGARVRSWLEGHHGAGVLAENTAAAVAGPPLL